MKNMLLLAAVAACFTLSGVATAEELTSGPKPGSGLGPFTVEKLCGAESDNVAEGARLCYRCKNGSRPQVMVFTRSDDAKVAQLVKRLDKAIDKHEDSDLRVFVNFMGDDKDDVVASAKKFAAKSEAKNIPFVLPNEFENGPDDYGINAKAAVTVVMGSDSRVKASYAVASAKDLDVDAVVKNLSKILN